MVKKYILQVILFLGIIIYTLYFSYFSILRYKTLYASYYDLGIMNQTVYNTYQAIRQNNYLRFLEMTDTNEANQIKRMAIHNDILLAFLAPFYFIHAGPETLLVIQTVVIALGALAIFGITRHILNKFPRKNIIALIFSFAYLLYPPMQRANIFDFHAVTLTTSFLLFMFYFWLKKNNRLTFLFFIFSLSTKEHIGLTTFLFGVYLIYEIFKGLSIKERFRINRKYLFPTIICLISLLWVFLSFAVIIPFFRGKNHFALEYYDNLNIVKVMTNLDTYRYFFFLLGPLAFLSLLSPLQLLIAVPEFVINLFSSNSNMHNIIYHYTSVIQPFVFISAIYGVRNLISKTQLLKIIISLIIICSVLFAYFKGPLPLAREQEIHPFKYPQPAAKETAIWAEKLNDDHLKISATGQLAPLFSSRRYLYQFSERYRLADYVVLRREEIYNYPDKEKLIPIYQDLQNNQRFIKIYDKNDLEVYKNIK